jgi:serine phosphatase RsbU (regulator of sigma subunit)
LKQKAEIEKQRDYANQQHEEIKKQKQQITDSIVYASRIQIAVLPQKSYIKNILGNYFILFKPRDIVSGDFYFFQQKGNLIYIVAADSTGHGVPGAFMSMLGITFLNAIINKDESANKIPFVGGFVDRIQEIRTKEPNAASILDALRAMVKNALGQTGAQDEAKDGMDLALCILNTKTLKMQYSGAHNPLYLFRDDSLIEYKGDRMPIGIHLKEKPFTDHTIQLKKGDAFYLFSDGFVDQFGGKNNSKYKAKRFKQFLAEIQENTMPEQKERLLNEFKTWKGTYEQVDDVIVIGVKI